MTENIEDFFRLKRRGEGGENYKIDCLFESIVPRKGIGVINGRSNIGKSLFAIWMATCLGTGSRIVELDLMNEKLPENFGIPENRGATIYFAGEGQNGIEGRIVAAESFLNSDVKGELPLGYVPILNMSKTNYRLDNTKQLHLIQNYLSNWKAYYEGQSYKIRLIIIDTLLASFEVHNDNDNSERQELVEALRQLSEMFDCFVFAITHPPKSGGGGLANARGAGALVNSADLIISVSKSNSSKYRSVIIEKSRDLPCGEMKFKFIIKTFENIPALLPVKATNEKSTENKSQKLLKLTDTDGLILTGIRLATELDTPNKHGIYKQLNLKEKDEAPLIGYTPVKEDTLRKQIDRSLKKLLEYGIVVRNDKENGKSEYSVIEHIENFSEDVKQVIYGSEETTIYEQRRNRSIGYFGHLDLPSVTNPVQTPK